MTVALLWLACAGAPQDSAPVESACESGEVVGSVNLLLGGGTLPGAAVYAQQEQEAPIQGLADGEGRYALTLPAGDWTVWAESSPGCLGDRAAVEVLPCETHPQELFVEICE